MRSPQGEKEDEKNIDAVIPRLDLNYYTTAPSQDVDLAIDLNITGNDVNRGVALWALMTKGNDIWLYKDGATTDLTVGHFRHIWYDLPRAWYKLTERTTVNSPLNEMSLETLGSLSLDVLRSTRHTSGSVSSIGRARSTSSARRAIVERWSMGSGEEPLSV